MSMKRFITAMVILGGLAAIGGVAERDRKPSASTASLETKRELKQPAESKPPAWFVDICRRHSAGEWRSNLDLNDLKVVAYLDTYAVEIDDWNWQRLNYDDRQNLAMIIGCVSFLEKATTGFVVSTQNHDRLAYINSDGRYWGRR